jgi:predicted  nucleic acid-binding Zn-ribbon protein
MSAALGLFRLQQVDSRMDKIRTRLDEIRQVLENDDEVRQAKARVEESNSAHHITLQALKRAEVEVEQQKVKIEQSESNLYSGSVKNPKELQDLQNEAASLKRHLMTLEDRQLEAMLEEEEAAHASQVALDELKKTQARLAEQHQSLIEEKATLDKDMERLDAERQAALTPLDASLLATYDNLRQQRRGLAVAEISEGACAACGTTLTASQKQNARSTAQIYNCPTCGRILFAN